jgi:hypothetical protein
VFYLLRERTYTLKFATRLVWSERVLILRHGVSSRHHVLSCGRDPGVQGFRDGTLLKRFASLRVRGIRARQRNHQGDYAIRLFHGSLSV